MGIFSRVRKIWHGEAPAPRPLPSPLPKPLSVYLQYLAREYEYLSLKGLLHGHIPRIRLRDVYIALKAIHGYSMSPQQLQVPERKPASEERVAAAVVVDESFYEDRRRSLVKVPIEEAIMSDPRIAILGEPGSGKTTFVRHLVARIIAEPSRFRERFGFGFDPIPIPIMLRAIDVSRLPDKAAMRDACVPEFLWDDVPRETIADALSRGSCMLIFDGLDEVTDPKDRRKVAAWIEQMAAALGDSNRYLVTSRIAGYNEAPLSSFNVYTLCDFDLDDIRSFVLRWYESVGEAVVPDEVMRMRQVTYKSERLLEVMDQKSGIQQLARNPLLLTIVLLLYTNRGRLPEDRAELYQQCVDVLLEHLQQAKLEDAYHMASLPLQRLSLKQRRDLLKAIAQWLHENERTAASREDLADRVLADLLPQMGCEPSMAQEFLRVIEERSGILVQRSEGLGFSHLAFQEFLAASALADLEETAAVDALMAVRFRSWWREVLQLYAGIVTDGTRLILKLMSLADSEYAHSLLLAGACLCDARKVHNLELRKNVIRRLTELYLTSRFSFHHRQARDVLARIGGIEVACVFLPILAQPSVNVVRTLNAVQVLSRMINTANVRPELIALAQNSNVPEEIRIAAVRGLRMSAHFGPDIEELLLGLMTPAHSVGIRAEAVTTLSQLTNDARIVDLLRGSVLEHADYGGKLDEFYIATAQAFLRRLEPEEALQIFLGHMGINGSADYKVELSRSVMTIEMPETRRIEILSGLLQNGPDWGARGGSALVLGLVKTQRNTVARELAQRLAVEPHFGVRFRIADALAHLAWREDTIVNCLSAALKREQHSPTARKIAEAYAMLTGDEVFIRATFVAPLRKRDTSDKPDLIAGLQRLRFYSDDVGESLINMLASADSTLAKSILAYIASAQAIPATAVERLRIQVRRVLSDDMADQVLKDRAFEAMFQLYGVAEAEVVQN